MWFSFEVRDRNAKAFDLLRIRRIILYFSMTAWIHVFGKIKLLFCFLQSNKRFCAETSKNSGKGIRNQTSSTRRIRNWCLLKLLRLKRKKFNEFEISPCSWFPNIAKKFKILFKNWRDFIIFLFIIFFIIVLMTKTILLKICHIILMSYIYYVILY